MQTFLPYTNYTQSAKALDYRRLGKQRVECKQIYLALTDPSYGWQNHPATNMWRGHQGALAHYGYRVCEEWRARGYKDSLLPFFKQAMNESPPETLDPPQWLTDNTVAVQVCRSHQSNLLRKDPAHYSQFDWQVPDDLEYVWPTS